jgi:sugar fermentation stimulation protein A|tara:strand:+ start:827 stop:1531 length:705 start_codon:yes stop_codon:yes gene_type:complete
VKIPGPLRDARFVERPNRFLTVVDIDGKHVKSHLPDPGRLKELLVPGARLKVRPRDSQSSHRRTSWTTLLVKKGRNWISIDSTLPNRFVQSLLVKRELSIFDLYTLVRREVKVGNHRFDFLLKKNGKPYYLEVKSVTFVEESVCMFPDAVTERGAKHALALANMVKSGVKAGILFVCQRSDAKLFRLMWDRDRRFSEALVTAEKTGVDINVITAKVTPPSITYNNQIPYDLTPF